MGNLRLWVGKEMEGPNEGLMTLFVEANLFDKRVNLLVQEAIDNEPFGIEAIYLGAGRVDTFIKESEELDKLLWVCRDRAIKVTIETTTQLSNYAKLSALCFVDFTGVNFVHTTDIPDGFHNIKDNLYTKYEWVGPKSGVQLTKFVNSYHTYTGTLDEGMYTNVDKLIFDSKKKEAL